MASGRSTRTLLAAALGLLAGLVSGAVLAALVVIWGAAVWSLVVEPQPDRVLTVLYAAIGVAVPVPLALAVRALSAMHRARLRAFGVHVLRPTPRWVSWPQLGYHVLVGVVSGAVAGAVATAGWWSLAALLPLPWLAPYLVDADIAAARRLLGPTRADDLAEQVEALARSRAEIVAATDAERRRIERDLHDGAQQRLVSLAMNLGMARANPAVDADKAIADAHDEAVQALAELREFVRGLHPAVLDDRGLDAALSGIAARAPLPVRLHVDVQERCSPTVEAIAYFTVSEALTNVAKHAAATGAEVTVVRSGDRLRVLVADDGVGGATADADGSGLQGLAQRAAAVDGTLDIVSPPGGGTLITVELPCES